MITCKLKWSEVTQSCPTLCAQRPPPASALPASREQTRRARAPTAGVVMAAAPSLTAALRGARAEQAGWPRASRRALGAGSHLNPRRAAHSHQEPSGPGCHLPGSSLPRHRGCPGTLRPFRRLPYVLAGGKGGRGSSGPQQIGNWLAPSLPGCRMPRQKLPNPALKSSTRFPAPECRLNARGARRPQLCRPHSTWPSYRPIPDRAFLGSGEMVERFLLWWPALEILLALDLLSISPNGKSECLPTASRAKSSPSYSTLLPKDLIVSMQELGKTHRDPKKYWPTFTKSVCCFMITTWSGTIMHLERNWWLGPS